MEVDPSGGDLPFGAIVVIDPTARQVYSSPRRRVAAERSLLLGLECVLDDDHTRPEDRPLDQVSASGERRDERSNELIADGLLSLQGGARNLKGHIVRVVGQNVILVRAGPRLVVFLEERLDLLVGP